MTTADPKADKAFLDFHTICPEVYRLFVRFAREAKAAGRAKVGAKMVAERIRWEAAIITPDFEPYKLNNNYVSRYARLAMMKEPDLVGLFSTRKLKVAPGTLPLLT